MNLDPGHMIEELQDNIKTGDAMKARLVLEMIDKVDSATQGKLLYILSRADVDFQLPVLLYLLSERGDVDKNGLIRNALFSCLVAFPEKLPALLSSPDIGDRDNLIRIAGELRCAEAVPVLIDILGEAESEAEILMIIETLGLIGDPQSVSVLTDYLYSSIRELILAAVQSLGQIGTPEATSQLAERMGTDNEIDLIILSIFAEIQDQTSIEQLSKAIRSPYAQMRTYAKQKLTVIGNKAVPALINNLSDDDPDCLIHTLNVLGDIGDEAAVTPIRHLLSSMPNNPNVRFAAYEALALLPVKQGAYTLTAGLSDSEEHVRLAAARAIERNYSDLFGVGIRNLLRGPGDEADRIVKTIVYAEVEQLFLALVDDEVFKDIAMKYLPKSHEDIKQRYYKLLMDNGHSEFARMVFGQQEEKARQKVVAVDDSRMILNIYKSTLHELGYEPVLFEFPASAVEWLETEKPLMVLTDLNMPVMTGVQLTERVRRKYPKHVLPILMVTTQNEQNDNSAAKAAGITAILNKPFTAKSLGEAMDKALGRE